MKKLVSCLLPAALLLVLAGARPAKKKITVWLIGDSTMSVKDVKAYPENGWGMPFVYFFDSSVTVDNRARNGRSTRSFMEEGLWTPVVNQLQEGDYVFIQFGHNDEVPTKKTYTKEEDFRNNLKKYIADTRSHHASPVLLTPVARRKFDSTGHIVETHAVYAQIVRDVAKEEKVPLIDLAEKGKALYQQMGPDASRYLFNYLAPGEHPNYPAGKQDDTHFSELGARKIAELVLADIRSLKLELADRIVVPVTK
ncbi:MAG: rhamnogalacturonan acetylesterase [Chitinophagaceae bacterium]